MPLVLQYPDKYRLWSDLIHGNSERVFIPTDETPALGSVVPVTLSLPGIPLQLVIEGAVLGLRARGQRFPAGVYLRFPGEQMDRCRRFIGLSRSLERFEQGRKSRRTRCELRLELLEPPVELAGMVKNLSEQGLMLAPSCELAVGQVVQGRLVLEDGQGVTFGAEVSWARNDRQLVGLRFQELPGEALRLIREEVARLHARAPRGFSQVQLLVADDQPNTLHLLGRTLGKRGYDVRTAGRGDEALDLIRELRPELVLLDILLPGIDGVEICKVMRSDAEMADIPVVLLSAVEAAHLHEIADQAGATDYLGKPVNLVELTDLVGRYLKPARDPAAGSA